MAAVDAAVCVAAWDAARCCCAVLDVSERVMTVLVAVDSFAACAAYAAYRATADVAVGVDLWEVEVAVQRHAPAAEDRRLQTYAFLYQLPQLQSAQWAADCAGKQLAVLLHLILECQHSAFCVCCVFVRAPAKATAKGLLQRLQIRLLLKEGIVHLLLHDTS